MKDRNEQLDADVYCALQVEPQEKKKTPKGRALKRIKYTRRFVNVTMTGGKRKVSFATAQTLQRTLRSQILDEPQPHFVNYPTDTSRWRHDGATSGIMEEL